MSNFLWVTKTSENIQFYSDSASKSNLSLHFASAIDSGTKKHICAFVRYLRKEFFFPIRCNIYFCNQEKFLSSKNGYCYGIFYSNDENNGRIYPQIYIPANMDIYSVYHSLCHELSHYFQWFFNDDKRSDRSLEVQASKCAYSILEDFCCYYCKRSDDSCKSCQGQ